LDTAAVNTFVGTGGGSFTPPLDAGNAVVAYGLRKLRTAYAGNAIRVRRSSDSTTQDIGFDANGNLDTTSLLSFVGAGSGYVTIWYDQTGHNVNVTQPTTSSQPMIVSSGSLNTIGNLGEPAIKFDGSNDYIYSSSDSTFPSGSSARTMNMVEQLSSTSGQPMFYAWGGNAAYNACLLWLYSTGIAFSNDNTVVSGGGKDTSPHVVNTLLSGTTASIYVDGSVSSGSISGTNTITGYNFVIGEATSSYFLNGNVSEIIIYSSALSSGTRTTLEFMAVAWFPAL
jgi:hypothetical protein